MNYTQEAQEVFKTLNEITELNMSVIEQYATNIARLDNNFVIDVYTLFKAAEYFVFNQCMTNINYIGYKSLYYQIKYLNNNLKDNTQQK